MPAGEALRDKMVKRRFGQLFADLNTGNKWICAYRFAFFLRRVQLCYVVVFQKDSFLMQLFISFIMEMLYVLALKARNMSNVYNSKRRQR